MSPGGPVGTPPPPTEPRRLPTGVRTIKRERLTLAGLQTTPLQDGSGEHELRVELKMRVAGIEHLTEVMAALKLDRLKGGDRAPCFFLVPVGKP